MFALSWSALPMGRHLEHLRFGLEFCTNVGSPAPFPRVPAGLGHLRGPHARLDINIRPRVYQLRQKKGVNHLLCQ